MEGSCNLILDVENKSHHLPKDLASLLDHPVLKATGCPRTGGGALAVINLLKECLQSDQSIWAGESLSAWAGDLRKRGAELSALCSLRLPEPAQSDLAFEPWASLLSCRQPRNRVHRAQRGSIDAVLAAAILQAAGNGTVVPTEFVSACRTLYRAASGNASHEEWKRLGVELPLDEAILNLETAVT